MREAQASTTYLKDYRVPDFLIDETHLQVDLFEDRTLVSSRLLMRRNPAAATQDATLRLDGSEQRLISLAIDGQALAEDRYQVDAEGLTIGGLPERFELVCVSEIKPQDNTSLEGLYQSGSMFCTQCEAEGFRKITYYLDRPDVLSVFTTTISAERSRYPVLLSNGNLLQSGSDEDGRHWATWHDPFPKPSYLFALVAGNLKSVEDSFVTCSGRQVKLQIFVEAKDLDKCGFAMDSLKRAMRWDEEVYGREYDLDIFMIVAVDHFNMGAMENKGLNIFNSSCVLANTAITTDAAFQRIEAIVAHEYFHNWSGNRVTCRDWFQLSLKEGFTVFRDACFSADMGSPTVKRVEDVSLLRTLQFAEDAGPMAHPVRPDSYMEISNFYTVTIYEKGAEVVRMLAQMLGPELFRRGTDLYFERFDGMAVTTEDFVRVMEEVSGLDLGQFRRWYTQAGTPVLEVSGKYDADNQRYQLTVRQSCPPTPGQPSKQPFHIPLTMGLLDAKGSELPLFLQGESAGAGDTSKVLTLRQPEEQFTFERIAQEPLPSLLRGFSAPVKLRMDYSREQLMLLIRHDSDGFARWEAAQQLATQVITDLMRAFVAGQPMCADPVLAQAWQGLLQNCLDDPELDKAMVAHLIVLPSEAYLAEMAEEIHVEAIHAARETLRLQLASSLRPLLAQVFETCQSSSPYEYSAREVARRSLANTALAYLVLADDGPWRGRCVAQFQAGHNMTDVSAALRILVNTPDSADDGVTQACLDAFYSNWRHESLVVEQWLSIQAGANLPQNLEQVQKLVAHEAFDIRTPNKVRAVIGAFCNQNLVGFHHASGAGYRFLADHIITLNKLNPQIAARQLTPLTRWHKHQPARQQLMREQLQRLLAEDLSRDVYEVVSKSLQA